MHQRLECRNAALRVMVTNSARILNAVINNFVHFDRYFVIFSRLRLSGPNIQHMPARRTPVNNYKLLPIGQLDFMLT